MKAPDGAEETNDNQNYSFQQSRLLIPAYTTNMDSAVLQSPLLGPSSRYKLPPLKKVESVLNDSPGEGNIETENSQINNAPTLTSASNSLVPHPPLPSKPTKTASKRHKSSINGHDTPGSTDNSDAEIVKKTLENETEAAKSDIEDIISRKLKEDNLLLNSYEDYLRQLSKEEEEGPEDDSSESGDSENDSDSSESLSSEFSLSSLSESDDEEDKDDSSKSKKKDFEPLYSLPIKPKKTKNSESENERKFDNSLKPEDNLELSRNSLYLTMNNENLEDQASRTQSAPDLRSSKLTRTLDTLGYMCPNRLPQLDGKTANFSSPELKQASFDLKYRPLPSIPHERTRNKQDRDDGIYEKIATRNMSLNSEGSPTKNKISFKDVANRVVSLMPRLTTREARSREADHYMADILRYLPDKKLRIFVGTWNMKGIKVTPDSLDDYLLPNESVFIQDIYAVGCQEGTPFRKEWEICLQETLGPTHVLMYSGNFGVLQLAIFVRRELVWFCTSIEQDTVATRIAHKIKTKGAIAVSFNVFGTSLLFINSHFASDVTSRYDRVFWFGDFNFRVNKTRAEVDAVFAERDFENRHERKNYIIKELLPHDQLQELLKKGKIFHGFQESQLTFLPTYKFDVNSDTYDTSPKKRVPSWTDRVLYKSRQPDQIKVSMYNCCGTIKGSDHRPVFAILEANIEPVEKNVLLPCAMFDREIYVEANMRRSAPKGSQQSSNVCTIL